MHTCNRNKGTWPLFADGAYTRSRKRTELTGRMVERSLSEPTSENFPAGRLWVNAGVGNRWFHPASATSMCFVHKGFSFVGRGSPRKGNTFLCLRLASETLTTALRYTVGSWSPKKTEACTHA